MTKNKRPGVADAEPLLKTTTCSRVDNSNQIGNQAVRKRGGPASRQKGDRIEREIVDRHRVLGVHSERYPLSGASRFRGSGHDVDVYAFGRDEAALVCEVKGRKSGSGFTTLERWLSDFDVLVLRRNNSDPLIVLPWTTWARLLERVRR